MGQSHHLVNTAGRLAPRGCGCGHDERRDRKQLPKEGASHIAPDLSELRFGFKKA